jgi:uncharacterized membrane protein YtjA (UPF0391 family)
VVNTHEITIGIPIAIFSFAGKQSKGENMLGWMIVFALISAVGALSSMSGAPAASMKITSFLFASLFLLGLLTYAIRGRAR